MFNRFRLVHKQLRLYKNFGLLGQKASVGLTLPIISLSRPYMAYMGTERSVVMITAPGRISNHILSMEIDCYDIFCKTTPSVTVDSPFQYTGSLTKYTKNLNVELEVGQ